MPERFGNIIKPMERKFYTLGKFGSIEDQILAPIARVGSMNLGALSERFKLGLLLYLIINSYICFSIKIYFSYFLRGKITN